jgi:hypothetical protein
VRKSFNFFYFAHSDHHDVLSWLANQVDRVG